MPVKRVRVILVHLNVEVLDDPESKAAIVPKVTDVISSVLNESAEIANASMYITIPHAEEV